MVLLVLDISQPISHQDSHLAKLIVEAAKPVVIVGNKTDLINIDGKRALKEYQLYVNRHLPQLSWAPIVFCSALKNRKVTDCLDMAISSLSEYSKQIDDKTLAQFLKQVQIQHQPTRRKKSGDPKVYSLRQIKSAPPVFFLKIKKKENLHPSYLRFVERRMREWFGFVGSPVRIVLNRFKF